MNDDQTVPGMAEAVEQRRIELGLDPVPFAAAAGLTLQGVAPVRAGARKNYSGKTRRGVARALQWPLDWYERLLAGEDPGGFTSPSTDDPLDVSSADDVDLTALREHDPEGWDLIMSQARLLLDRARNRDKPK